jgi:hypothetical protein
MDQEICLDALQAKSQQLLDVKEIVSDNFTSKAN